MKQTHRCEWLPEERGVGDEISEGNQEVQAFSYKLQGCNIQHEKYVNNNRITVYRGRWLLRLTMAILS